MSSPNSRELVERYCDGDSQAAREVYDRYLARLLGLVRQKMSPRLRQRIDAEDVVQSAYRSFFLHAKDEKYVLAQAGDLWRLLAGIALNKLHGQIERHTAGRRDIGREHRGELDYDLLAGRYDDLQPTTGEAIALAELVRLTLGRMSASARQAIEMRLCGETVDDIAAAIGRSPRTVRRLLDNARRELEAQLLGDDNAGRRASEHWPADPRATLSYSDFTLEQLVGAGGMGKVYRATQRGGERPVALIKALHKKWQHDRVLVESFVHEALVLSRFDHPHIVKLYGLGQFPGGGFFLAMEYLSGKSLQALIESGSLPLSNVAPIFRQVVSAVGYVHELGIVHCDIKPANVLFAHDGRVAVSDFGFAQLMQRGKGPILKPHLLGGTSGYTAPELLARGAAKIAPTVDIYSLGALLHAMIVGRPPSVDGTTAWPPEQTELGRWLKSISDRCLAQRPNDRYQSAGEILLDLDSAAGAA